jgi:hypothetical protein
MYGVIDGTWATREPNGMVLGEVSLQLVSPYTGSRDLPQRIWKFRSRPGGDHSEKASCTGSRVGKPPKTCLLILI